MKHSQQRWDDRVAVAIMVGAWLFIGFVGLGMELWEFRLWLMYVM